MTDTTAAPPSATVLVSRTRPLSADEDPLACLQPGGFAWFRDGAGMATAGVAARIPVPAWPGRIGLAAERVAEALAAIEVDDPLGWPGTGPLAVGALPFSDDESGELVIPSLVVGRTADGRAWITETGPVSPALSGRSGPEPPQALAISLPPEAAAGGVGDGRAEEPTLVGDADARASWTDAVNRALGLIAAGTVSKVVLARQVEVRGGRPFDPSTIVDRLRRAHPACWTYAMGSFVGASPELLVRRRGDMVESRPMAGTVAQGRAGAENERLVACLESSAKERAEHAVVVDDVVAGLAPVCREISAPSEPDVVRLATVAHLATTVSGRLVDPPPTALALAGRLHPTPAVAGAPREAALAAIAEMEDFDRGLYAGPVGWVDRRGDGEFAVALRGAELRGHTAVLTAGAGIVSDSDADAEWQETQAKLQAMLDVLAET